MKRILFLVVCVLSGALISSCQNASFTEVNTTPPPTSDFWFTSEPTKHISGEVHIGGGYNPPLLNATIIVAWEIPNNPSKSMYVYGAGKISKLYNKYNFDVSLRDTLPKFVLMNMDTTNAIGAGHIFLIDNPGLKDGDTLRHDLDWDNKYHVLGSMNDIGVIFIKGKPTLAGRPLTGSLPGFILFHARRLDPSGQTVTDFELADPFNIEIEIDDNGKNCKDRTPFWLQ